MTDSGTEFALLRATLFGGDGQALMLLKHIAGDTDSGLQLGVDQHGRRHVLAAIPEDYALRPKSGESVTLDEWRAPGGRGRFMDLVCGADPLRQVFAALADDIAERVNRQGLAPEAAILAALEDWHKLLRPAKSLSEEAARGLFGELTVLRWLAKHNPHFAADSWTGPDGATHDFSTGQGDIEVKTSSQEGLEVVISSLSQLDRVGDAPLVLVRVHVASAATGQNVAELVDDLVNAGCLRSVLVEKIGRAGMLLGVDADEHRFVVDSEPTAWEVDDDFPGLRSHDLPAERRAPITRVQYTLSLVGARQPLSAGSLETVLSRMMATPCSD